MGVVSPTTQTNHQWVIPPRVVGDTTLGSGWMVPPFRPLTISLKQKQQLFSLPNNTIAIIFAARKHLIDFPVKCISYDETGQNETHDFNFEQALTAPVQCKWTVYIAICPVVHKPQVLSLTTDVGTSQVVSKIFQEIWVPRRIKNPKR